ncbi:fibronectin type III domain-containing protein, partial [Candidatus Woesearchaeota archaeon]|nr:fibronectin type III domain-containing protein [Candidatus Woesearchaeota archaeon]
MKKLLGILMLLILIPGVLGLTLVDENPGDSTTITDTSSSTPFNITTAETLSSGFVYIDSVGYGMSCAGTICNLDKDLSAKLELDTVQYYFQISDGGPLETFPAAGYYEATVDRDPAQVQNLVVSSASETALDLNWDANTEGDIDYYNVYENSTGTFIVIDTTTDNNYTDSGLTTGVEYFYQVSAVDTQTNEGLVSAIDSGIPQDTTPPADPTIDPVSGSVVTTTPTITITYAEEVYDARIYAGTTEFAALGDDTSAPYEYTWNPTLLDNALYIFNITAEDSYGNRGSYMYTLSTTSGTVDIIIGDEPPLYINIVEDYPAAYDPIYTTQLDIDWTDDVAIDTVTINFDEVDYVYGIDPEVTVVGDTYTASFLGLDAGIHNYSWTASDTKGQENMTTEQIFTINKADPGIAIIFDPVSPVSEYTETNATCSALSAAELYRNEVLLTGLEDIATLDAGTHEYNCTVAGDTN